MEPNTHQHRFYCYRQPNSAYPPHFEELLMKSAQCDQILHTIHCFIVFSNRFNTVIITMPILLFKYDSLRYIYCTFNNPIFILTCLSTNMAIIVLLNSDILTYLRLVFVKKLPIVLSTLSASTMKASILEMNSAKNLFLVYLYDLYIRQMTENDLIVFAHPFASERAFLIETVLFDC